MPIFLSVSAAAKINESILKDYQRRIFVLK